jgi:hypothetical protein
MYPEPYLPEKTECICENEVQGVLIPWYRIAKGFSLHQVCETRLGRGWRTVVREKAGMTLMDRHGDGDCDGTRSITATEVEVVD